MNTKSKESFWDRPWLNLTLLPRLSDGASVFQKCVFSWKVFTVNSLNLLIKFASLNLCMLKMTRNLKMHVAICDSDRNYLIK